jgi:hypothetical protein
MKSKMDNSFEFLQASPDIIKKQYEFLSDIIRDCNGKVHGSQSHISNNSMYLIVYYEVPEGQREEVKKRLITLLNIRMKWLVPEYTKNLCNCNGYNHNNYSYKNFILSAI